MEEAVDRVVIDKRGVLERLDQGSVEIEIGCGGRKRHESAIGIDALDYPCVDIVGDVFSVLDRFPDGTASAVYTYHFFEHVADLPALLTSLARVLKPGGTLTVVTPHFSNPYYYSDHTHRSPFGLYSFSYLAQDEIFTRRVPDYQQTPDFRLQSARLHFKSERPFYGRWAVKRALQGIFNSSRYMQEFYEENLCYLFPCYEIRFELERL